MNMLKKSFNKKNIPAMIGIILCVAAFIYIPNKEHTSKYMMKVIDEGMLYFVAVLGLSVMLGMGGQVTFSTAGMMGVGAYGTAILTTVYGVNPVVAVLISVIVGSVFSYLIGHVPAQGQLFRLCLHRSGAAHVYDLLQLDGSDWRPRRHQGYPEAGAGCLQMRYLL